MAGCALQLLHPAMLKLQTNMIRRLRVSDSMCTEGGFWRGLNTASAVMIAASIFGYVSASFRLSSSHGLSKRTSKDMKVCGNMM